jgi:hypothetical protein
MRQILLSLLPACAKKATLRPVAVALCLLPMPIGAQAPQTNADALSALHAFRCWGYAEASKYHEYPGNITKQTIEQEHLFQIGYSASIKFLAAFRRGEISEKSVPVGALWKMQGPSDEFIIGRMFEAAASGAGRAASYFASEETKEKKPDEGSVRQMAKRHFESEDCPGIK